jgi:small-conductance mechanosensitive channel
MHHLRAHLPDWALEWLDVLVPLFQILLILLLAYVLYRFIKRLVRRMAQRHHWPIELTVPLTCTARWVILAATLLAVLERLGVSATVLWTGFSSFAAVGAVAFFAAWSVLSNFFCALLIFTVRPFRLGDYIELLDTTEKPGAKGRVIDINMLYTTLEEFGAPGDGNRIQIPNSLVFQRVLRRWNGLPPPLAQAENKE